MKAKTADTTGTAVVVAVLAAVFLAAPMLFAAQIASVPDAKIPEFSDDLGCADLGRAIEASIAYYSKLPDDRVFVFGENRYSAAELAAGMQRFRAFVETGPSQAQLDAFLKQYARVYAFLEAGRPVKVLFTGYYEPVLAGSRGKSKNFPYPVYARPRDLVRVDLRAFDSGCRGDSLIGRSTGDRVVPYYDRRTIETTEVMKSRAPVIAWVKDPIKRFFLHVQGSGRIVCKDGDVCRVQYDITNGRPYRSIGKYLIDTGKIRRQDMSMQAIAAYIRKHPEEMQTIFFYNPRYVFFRKARKGPVGSLGVKLTPGRSVALDQKITPSGALVYISAEKPICRASGEIDHWEPFSRLMCSQDTGSAIRGPRRADIFWGSGDYAETAAGYMKHRGRLYFLVIDPHALPHPPPGQHQPAEPAQSECRDQKDHHASLQQVQDQ